MGSRSETHLNIPALSKRINATQATLLLLETQWCVAIIHNIFCAILCIYEVSSWQVALNFNSNKHQNMNWIEYVT